MAGHHELDSRTGHVEFSSNRSFGLVFAAVFALIAAAQYWKGRWWWIAFLIAALGILFVTLFNSDLLAPLNRAWGKLGIFLGKIVNPIVLGLIFYLVITPLGLVRGALGLDRLRLKKSSVGPSNWISRNAKVASAEDFRHQF